MPDIETSVRPAGNVSVTVTVPLVGPAAAPLLTATVYTARSGPARSAGVGLVDAQYGVFRLMIVESVALAGTNLRRTRWRCSGGDAASTAFTVAMIGG